MSNQERPADRIRKLVALAAGADGHEAAAAQAKAREALAGINVELLDTLAGQRKSLRAAIHEEQQRLYSRKARPGAKTRDLMDRAALLLGHYERYDALISAVLLTRVEAGHLLTGEERQQLDGPQQDMFNQW
jgi:hypothetical protein